MNKSVYNYYKDVGWKKNSEGQFDDTVVNEALREVSYSYNRDTRNRIKSELENQPKCLYEKILDCALGPDQYPEYVDYSLKFKSRYCIDFSPKALKYAKVNLAEAGQTNCKFISLY